MTNGVPHSAILCFSDGKQHEVLVEPGESVLDAALKANIPVLYQCRSGACSSCSAHIVEGCANIRAGAPNALLQSEIADGVRLLCSTELTTNATFTLGYDSSVGKGGARRASAFIDRIEAVAGDAVRLVLELAEGDWLDFRPGQFVQVKIPGTDQLRSYSIATIPSDLPRIELLIRILPGGAMSTWLTQHAKVDDILELEGPFGSFLLSERDRRPHIMIAGGTGLAPIVSMIDAIRTLPGNKPKIQLSFGCASQEGLFYKDELILRQQWLPQLSVILSVEHGTATDELRIGNPVEAIQSATEDSVAYLCGPAGLIDAGRKHLERLGLRPENIHSEQFVASN